MRSRQEIKANAKYAFMAQYGNCVLVVFLVSLLSVAIGLITGLPGIIITLSSFMEMPITMPMATLEAFNSLFAVLSLPITLLVLVVSVNLCGTLVKAYYNQPIAYSEPYTEIKVNFGRKLGGMFWKGLWTWLWGLVGLFSLFIPTIVKALSYSMADYILACHPNVPATEALKLSMRMTKGHKGKLFVLYLSFIGWQILSGLTIGILGIFYVNPYMQTTFAGFFVELRDQAVQRGAIHPAEFDGAFSQQYIPQSQYSAMPPYAQQPQYPSASPYTQQPQYSQAPPYAQQPQYPPTSPYTQQPQYPPAPPYAQQLQYPPTPPYAQQPEYPPAPPYTEQPQYPPPPPSDNEPPPGN
jgi:uncharacterized membrane protein